MPIYTSGGDPSRAPKKVSAKAPAKAEPKRKGKPASPKKKTTTIAEIIKEAGEDAS